MKNLHRDGAQISCAVISGVVSGDPVVVNGIPGVASTSRDVAGKATVDFVPGKIYKMAVNGVNDDGNSAVAEGNELFYTAGDAIKLSKKKSGIFWGWALAATPGGTSTLITSGQSATINVRKADGTGQAEAEHGAIVDAAATAVNPAAITATEPAAVDAQTSAAPAAETYVAPAAMTAPVAGAGSGADGTTYSGAECDALRADVVAIRDALILLAADGSAVHAQVTAAVADIAAIVTAVEANNEQIDASIVDVTATRAETVKLVTDLGVIITKLNSALQALRFAKIIASA